MAGELTRLMNQVPVVPKGQHCFFLSGDFHFAECHGSRKVLLVERAQTGGVEVLLQDSAELSIRLTMDNSAERRSILDDKVKMGFDSLGSKKCVLVKGSRNGCN